MTCQACGADIPAGARFCPACGAAVAAACRSCGAELPAGARFCASCGAAVGSAAAGDGTSAAGPGRERKVATLLFADLVGFTALGESHDPEVVGALVGEVFARLGLEVARYEGTIEKFAGDAMLAVFGVPTVHEDDPERAVRAALEMQAAMHELSAGLRERGQPEPALRIGVETGEVLVDLARAGKQRDLFVTGDAVNTAARLEQTATPGTIVVGPGTYAATRDVVDYEELPAGALKGKSVAVAAWRAIAVKARRGGRRPSLGIEAPVVGRDEEIGLLKETVRRAVADGRPHLITIVGAAGVGKSRLTWELEKYLDGLPETYHWRKGRCLAYAQASYSAMADVIKVDARIMDDDAPATALAKLDDRIRQVHGEVADPSIAEALRAVLALGPMGALSRDRLFEAWRRHLDAVSRLAPLVLVLEDIHWADEGLLDVIEFLARWGEGPTTILCLARHELLERRPGWGGGMLNASTIVLEPLDPAESSTLVDGLLGSAIPAQLRDRIVELADGNPLFTEELVRMFVDRGVLRFADGAWELAGAVEEIQVPGSVQAVLAARLDGLPAEEKRLAQNAAVVGRIFWDAVVAHLSRQGPAATNDLLRRLRVKELVVPREPSSLAGAAEFGFRHVLIRDVAYDSLPKRDRATLHLAVANWAEEALAERRAEFVELLAAHYVAALRYEEEFGTEPAHLRELRARTFACVRDAARWAHSLGQLESATRWIRFAVDQGRRLDLDARAFADLVIEYERIGFANESGGALAPVVREALDRLLAAPERAAEDERSIARLRTVGARALYLDQRPAEAETMLEEGLAQATDPVARADLLSGRGWVHWRLGQAEPAIGRLEEAVELARAAGSDQILRLAMHDLGIARTMAGQTDPGLALVEESFRLAKAGHDTNLIDRCLINLPSVRIANGDDWREVVPLLDEGIERARRSVNRMTTAWIGGNYGEVLWQLGRIPEARAMYEESRDAAAALGDAEVLAGRTLGAAMMAYLMGDREVVTETVTDEVRRLTREEVQVLSYLALLDGWLAWPDADAAIERLLVPARRELLAANGELPAALLARIGLRAGRMEAVAAAVEFVDRATFGSTGPYIRLVRDAIHGLAEEGPAAASALEAIGAELLERGYRLPAADVFADAAIVARRAGLDGVALGERARALFADCSVVPVLGDPVDALAEPAARPA